MRSWAPPAYSIAYCSGESSVNHGVSVDESTIYRALSRRGYGVNNVDFLVLGMVVSTTPSHSVPLSPVCERYDFPK